MITRIAPSPTGVFHLGTARTAYLNWLAARATDGKFILRIDDTDKSRHVDGAEQLIFDSLDWLGLTPDYVFRQSETFDRCRDVANQFVADGRAVKEDGAVILKSDPDQTSWYDEVVREVKVSADDRRIASRIVLLKSDGDPTYIFSSVVNDYDSGIDMVIRGVDHISNTLRQILIFNLLGRCPKFAHVGLVRFEKKKLSKRDNPPSVLDYKLQGYCPDAILAFLLRQGWSPKDPTYNEPIRPADAVKMFWDAGHMNSKCSNLDFGKLNWMQTKLAPVS